MTLEITSLPSTSLPNISEPDEITIILNAPQKCGSLAKELLKTSIPTLNRKNHYVTSAAGFFDSTRKPWVVVDMIDSGANSFERRWALQEWSKSLRSIYAVSKLVIYFDDSSTSEQIVWAEDIITSGMHPTYHGSKWTTARLFAANPPCIDCVPRYSFDLKT